MKSISGNCYIGKMWLFQFKICIGINRFRRKERNSEHGQIYGEAIEWGREILCVWHGCTSKKS